MKINHKTLAPLFVVLVGFLTLSPSANSATMTDLGLLSGADYSDVYAISADGSVVVGQSGTGTLSSQTTTRAFKYSNGTMIDLGTLSSGNKAAATGVSSNGSVIVGYGNITNGGTIYHAFKYSGSTMTDLGTLGGINSYAQSVSSDGLVIVGGASTASASHAFKYVGSTMTDLGTLGTGDYSEAYGASNDGSVIVGYSYITSGFGGTIHAFKYTGTTMTDIGTLGGTHSEANNVSADGNVIIGYSQTTGNVASHAFKYIGTSMTDLGTLGGSSSYAYGVSSDGSVIVGQADTATATHAFKYSDGTMTDIGTLGGSTSYAYGVTADGKTIVGTSETSTSGVYHAFIYNNNLVDVNNTYTTLHYNGAQLSSLMNLKNSLLKNSLTQDCNKFGANNMCISLGYRYANTNHYNAQENATNLKLAYRVTPNFRIGTVLDQAFSSSDPQNFRVKNSQPLVGVFANFSQNPDETGLNLRMSAAYHNSKMSVTRNVLANTEAGVGSTNLKSTGLLAELSYAAKISDKIQIKPFVGMRQTEISRNAYSETSGASFPITYEAVKQKFTTAIFGVRSNFELSKSVGLTFGAGVEQNLRSRVDGYSGAISQVGSFSLASPNVRKTTAFVDAGVNYEINAAQRLSSNVIYGTQALNTAKVAMVYLNYSVGF